MSFPAITIYTVLFTLAGRDPSKNKYVDMFYIWLSFLIRNAGLGSMDSVVILIDAPTLDYINSVSTLDILSEDITFQLVFDEIPVPANTSIGMCCRYTHSPMDTEFSLYLDLDILIMRNVHTLVKGCATLSADLFIMPEGLLIDPNYGALIKSADWNAVGYTGCWLLYRNDAPKTLFKEIADECIKNAATPFYTVDQPYYNLKIYQCLQSTQPTIRISVMSDVMAMNLVYLKEETYFVNFCGDVGNEMNHFNKLLMMLCLCYSLPAGFKPMSSELREALDERALTRSAAHQAAAPALPGEGHSHTQSQSP